jgi:predicted nucleic-acid-binding Zn-ribbon protein
MSDVACPKCGSKDVIKDVRIIDHAHYNTPFDLCATVYREPDNLIFKNPASHRFQARVCGACGFTEFYVENARRLFEIAEHTASKG